MDNRMDTLWVYSNELHDSRTKELHEWRAGKRRVFWRVRYTVRRIRYSFDFASKGAALGKYYAIRGNRPKLYRVTVRPKVKP